MRRSYRVYDHRLKDIVIESGDPNLFPELNIPKSTAREWIKKGSANVITIPELNLSSTKLIEENASLKKEISALKAAQELKKATIKIFGFQIQHKRAANADSKLSVLEAIKKAAFTIPIGECLEIVGLSSARYHSWKNRARKCELDDKRGCGKFSPLRTTLKEIGVIREMVTDPSLSHYSISALSWSAKRAGKMFASASTWCRIVKQLKLRRPRERLYPPKPKIGIRANGPCQIWHLDQSLIKLTNGKRVYIQAIIDNYSRFILSWQVTLTYGGASTKLLIEQAIKKSREYGFFNIPELFVDSGTENLNKDVNSLVEKNSIWLTIAQLDVEFSNSMIEALFLRLKHHFLYLKNLTSFEVLLEYVSIYFSDSNLRMPHPVLNGATPLEVLTGKWNVETREKLLEKTLEARVQRRSENRANLCKNCISPPKKVG